jgi:hypothetical protein
MLILIIEDSETGLQAPPPLDVHEHLMCASPSLLIRRKGGALIH